MKTQWYVIYFKGPNEKKLADILTRKKIVSYFPVSKVVQDWSIDNKVFEQTLFSSYLFVHATENQLLTVKKIPSVINLVYWLGKPVIISDTEIFNLKKFLDEHINVKVEKITVGKGIVKRISHPVIDNDTSFKIINQNIDIVLPSLGYKITAEETSHVRIISPNRSMDKTRFNPSKLFNPAQIFTSF